ncbi:MAG: hypothetical protein FJ088_16575, partial [Deltaproteobacteria bacterium]|nr:hypothetical protein [Deltaproteobacteria bacterium]
MKIHKKKASPEKASELNIEFLDASVEYVESLTDYKIATMYGEGDPEYLKQEISAAGAEVRGAAKAAVENGVDIPFQRLVRNYSLDDEETLILQIALAPYLDSSFKKRISRVKDNILLDYVDADFLLTIMFDSRIQRLRGREYFLRKSKLISERLVTMTIPRDAVSDSLLIHEVGVPERIVNFVLGHDALDRTIVNCSALLKPFTTTDEVVLDETVKADLEAILAGFLINRGERGLVFQINGQPGTGKSLLASYLSAKFDRQMILVDSFKLAGDEMNFKT